ncbi:MAG: branched-chain amino acid ABC transporter permease [Hyphomonadaceae bacterium]
MAYWAHLFISVAMFFMLALGLRFFSAKTGAISLMHAAFMAIGAYANALGLSQGYVAPFGWVLGAGTAAIAAFFFSGAVFRARGDFFAVLTITLQLAMTTFLMNADVITNGPRGLSNIPPWPFVYGPSANAAIVALVASLIVATFVWLERSLWSTTLGAINDDEILMESLGYDTGSLKKYAFTLSAAVCGVVGAIYAQYVSYIDPTAFQLAESILILTIVVLAQKGGLLSLLGASVLVIAFPEFLRFLPSEAARAANLREIVYAGMLAILLVVRHHRVSVSRDE